MRTSISPKLLSVVGTPAESLRPFRWGVPAILAAALVSCGPVEQGDESSLDEALTVSHRYDLASQMPERLAIMLSMSWFGIGAGDRNGTLADTQLDPTYGNWRHGTEYVPTNARCTEHSGAVCVGASNPNACVNGQRDLASRYRPLAGIYSVSGRDTESQRRIDLMLSTLTATCGQGARVDAWAVQLNEVNFTSRHPSHHQAATDDYAWRAYQQFLARADANGLQNVILPGYDSTWYFHFGNGGQLGDQRVGKCDDSSSSDAKSKCMDAIRDDLVDMLDEGSSHASALRINHKPVVQIYVDTQYMTPAQWKATLDAARNLTHNARTGAARKPLDFYTVATASAPYFIAFDALTPWIHTEQWKKTPKGGSNQPYDHALNWVKARHDALVDACSAGVSGNPGCVVFGGVNPGFDDFTKSWGCPCIERRIPDPDADGIAPRHPDLLRAHFDYFDACKKGTGCTPKHSGYDFKGMLMMTWDDYTEGSIFEPNVEEGPARLLQLRQRLGVTFGDIATPTADSVGDAALVSRWTQFGQARSCDNNQVRLAPPLTLLCPRGSTLTGQVTALGSDAPLANAKLSLAGVGSTVTDAAGHYGFSGVTSGRYTLTASANGYLPRDSSVVVGAEAVTQNVKLSTSGKIVGSATGANGVALAGVTIRLRGGLLPVDVAVTTSASGHFDSGWLPVTTASTGYQVTCSKSGFATRTYAAVPVVAGAETRLDCRL